MALVIDSMPIATLRLTPSSAHSGTRTSFMVDFVPGPTLATSPA